MGFYGFCFFFFSLCFLVFFFLFWGGGSWGEAPKFSCVSLFFGGVFPVEGLT